MGVPVILVDGQVVIGFDRSRLDKLLASSGNGRRPKFGLKIADAGAGAFVGGVAEGSPGEHARLMAGDIITAVNSHKVAGAADLERVLVGLKAGSYVSISFLRQGQARRGDVVV